MNITFQYPPELMSLLIEAIPSLCKSKQDVLLFFRGAGINLSLTKDLAARVEIDRAGIGKHEIVRTVLTRLNVRGEAALRERREILKRVTEFEDFSTCWPGDQLKAKGLVAEIRRVVDVKDSFTRMKEAKEEEAKKHQTEEKERVEKLRARRRGFEKVRNDLAALFGEKGPHRRGKLLEGVLNSLFQLDGILVREAFELVGSAGEGVIEQIDGVIELDGEIYLVEMRWWSTPLGPGEVAQHLVRVFGRSCARGIFISESGYTNAGVGSCAAALEKAVVVLCELEEFVKLLEREGDLKQFLKSKIRAAIIDKNPLHRPLA